MGGFGSGLGGSTFLAGFIRTVLVTPALVFFKISISMNFEDFKKRKIVAKNSKK